MDAVLAYPEPTVCPDPPVCPEPTVCPDPPVCSVWGYKTAMFVTAAYIAVWSVTRLWGAKPTRHLH